MVFDTVMANKGLRLAEEVFNSNLFLIEINERLEDGLIFGHCLVHTSYGPITMLGVSDGTNYPFICSSTHTTNELVDLIELKNDEILVNRPDSCKLFLVSY